MSGPETFLGRLFQFLPVIAVRLRDRIFPPRCGGCGKTLVPGRALEFCDACLVGLPWIKKPFCLKCGKDFHPSGGDDRNRFVLRVCASCRTKRPSFASARSAFRYEGVARKAVQALKFRGRKTLAESFAILLDSRLEDEPGFLEGVEMVIPVPLHASRRRERGFNQSALVALALSRRWGIPVSETALVRNRQTRSQVGLSAPQRADNIRGAFTAGAEVRGKVILLVDDVMTTGATASACARGLRQGGAEETRVLTLARD